jgi:hypothetical protein
MTPEGGGRGPVAQASRLWEPPAPSLSSYPNPWAGLGRVR